MITLSSRRIRRALALAGLGGVVSGPVSAQRPVSLVIPPECGVTFSQGIARSGVRAAFEAVGAVLRFTPDGFATFRIPACGTHGMVWLERDTLVDGFLSASSDTARLTTIGITRRFARDSALRAAWGEAIDRMLAGRFATFVCLQRVDPWPAGLFISGTDGSNSFAATHEVSVIVRGDSVALEQHEWWYRTPGQAGVMSREIPCPASRASLVGLLDRLR